jgi:hypothetical protein
MEDGRLWATLKQEQEACTSLRPEAVLAAQDSAANQYMHQPDFDVLVARFEDLWTTLDQPSKRRCAMRLSHNPMPLT